jgi:hypothetical protein
MYNSPIMSKKNWSLCAAAVMAVLGLMPALGRAQQAPEIPVEEIIKKFAEKEKEFKLARDNYVFRQDVRVQELSDSGRVVGEYQATTDISFDDKGRRTERVIRAPVPTLKNISMTKEDFDIIASIQPFVLTSDDVGLYNLKFTGKEKLDEIDCFVFDVSPKRMEKGRIYFEGKIWVDDADFQIVKTFGKPVPEDRNRAGGGENLFGKFETYREQIDGKYWFPTYTRVEDTLRFSTGPIKIRQIIRYTDYRQFQTSVKLRFGGEATDEKDGSKTDGNLAPALDPRLKTDPKADPKSQPNQKK